MKLEVCPTEESKFQLVRIALLLRDPNASAQDLIDLINPDKKKEMKNARTKPKKIKRRLYG